VVLILNQTRVQQLEMEIKDWPSESQRQGPGQGANMKAFVTSFHW
jgi:hypothetical protein